MNNQGGESATFPFLSILTLIFVMAKILGFITWSWLLVFSPILFGTTVMVVAIIISAYIIERNGGGK